MMYFRNKMIDRYIVIEYNNKCSADKYINSNNEKPDISGCGGTGRRARLRI